MNRLTNEQRLQIIEFYYQNQCSVRNVFRALRPIYGLHNRPSEQTINAIVTKFRTQFTLLDIKPTTRMRTEENIASVSESVAEDREMSIGRRSQQLGLCYTTTWKVLRKDLGVKKQKAKKRKHSNTGQEDEVANKSVIVEDVTQPVEEAENSSIIVEQVIKKNSKKRKNKDNGTIKEKRPKPQETNADDEEHEGGHKPNENEMRQPTLEELYESEKPENNLAIVTGRQKKKQKRQKLLDAQKDQSIEREKLRNEEYLNKWKNSREEWKFENLRQISIQQTMFEENKLNAEVWSIALDYLAGSKGAAKDKIVKIANDVIDGVDKSCEELEVEDAKQELLNSVKYQRARNLLQIFD